MHTAGASGVHQLDAWATGELRQALHLEARQHTAIPGISLVLPRWQMRAFPAVIKRASAEGTSCWVTLGRDSSVE